MYLQKSCNSAFYTMVRLKWKPLEKGKKANPVGEKLHYLVLANLKLVSAIFLKFIIHLI